MNIKNFKKFAEDLDLASKAQALASTPEGRAKVEEFRKAVNNFSHNNYIMNALATNQNIDESTNPLKSAFYTFVGNPANQAKTWLVELGQGNKSKINKMLAEHPELAYYSSGLTQYGRPEAMHINDELKYVPISSKPYLEGKNLQGTIKNMGDEITRNGISGTIDTVGNIATVVAPGIGGAAVKGVGLGSKAVNLTANAGKGIAWMSQTPYPVIQGLKAAPAIVKDIKSGTLMANKWKNLGRSALLGISASTANNMVDEYNRATAKDNLFNRFNKVNPMVDIYKDWDNASEKNQNTVHNFLAKNFGLKSQGPLHKNQFSPMQEKYLAELTSNSLQH